MSQDIFVNAVESAWEDYDQYMIETGQWLTEHDYNNMMEAEYIEQMRAAYSYEYGVADYV